MQALALFEYPELILAGILSFIVLLFSMRQEKAIHSPAWLAEPAKSCLALAPARYLLWINKSLIYAGWRNNFAFGDFASLKLYPALLSLTSITIMPIYLVCFLALAFFFMADFILLVYVQRRQRQIYHSLPQAIDLMVLCVDAGLGLDATVQKIAAESTGLSNALNDELNILGREILLGMDREKAYQDLYNRTGVDELKTFGSALAQASKLGLSVAQILRSQSEFIRKKQSQKIEEKAMRMPIYMAFPLWFCIMPSLMLLVLGPSLIKFYQQMH